MVVSSVWKRLDRIERLLVLAIVSCTFLCLAAGVARAAGPGGTQDSHTTNGWNWWDESWMQTGSTFYAWGETSHANSGQVPINYMGILPRAYKDDGSANPPLCETGSWEYNGQAGSSISAEVPSPGAQCGEGYAYFSQAESRWYNGGGYDTYTNLRSTDANT